MKTGGIYFFDFDSFEIVTGFCNHTFPRHVHSSLCIGVLTEGKAVLATSDTCTLLATGNLFVIPPHTIHAFAPGDQDGYGYVTVCLKEVPPPAAVTRYTAAMTDLLESHPDVPQLSAMAHISKFHFIRQFKKIVGVSPHQYHLLQKVKKIRQGVLTAQPLSDLALSLKFSDQSHLCNTFKRFMGLTPLQYRCNYYNKAGQNFAKI